MKKTYSGKYKPINPEKYLGDVNEIVYRSSWERACFKWADKNSNVVQWASEEVVIKYFYEVDQKFHRYFVDLVLIMKDGTKLLIEIKPEKETQPPKTPSRKTKRYIQEGMTFVKNQNKWQAARKWAKVNGYQFQIWTETTLRAMGLLPKPFKKLKPLKKL